MAFAAQRHDAHLFLVASVWDHMVEQEPETFEGPPGSPSASGSSKGLKRRMKKQMETTLGNELQHEVIPRRDMNLMLERRRTHFLVDMRLMLRRLAHYMAVTTDLRLEWQRMMTRARCLDAALKDIFTSGVETPDGSSWRKGFPFNLAGGRGRRGRGSSSSTRHTAWHTPR